MSWELHPRPLDSESSDSVCVDLAVPHLSSEQLQVSKEHGAACKRLQYDTRGSGCPLLQHIDGIS